MPVILRWLLMDLVVSRVLRRYRMRRYGVDSPVLMGRNTVATAFPQPCSFGVHCSAAAPAA